MVTPPTDTKDETNHHNETSEIKRPLQYHEVDESLSEWELARIMSKTWSMEQY